MPSETFQITAASTPIPVVSLCWPRPPQETLQHQQVVLVQSPVGVTAPFLWVLVHTRFCLCPPKLESLLSPILGKSYTQIPLAFKILFLGDSQSLCQIPRLGSLTWGSESSQWWEILLYYCCPVCRSPTWKVWDLILSGLCPSYHLTSASSLSLDMEHLFLVGSRSNPSILKEISPEFSLERLMLKLKLQYFGRLMGRTDWLEKTLMLEKIKGRRRTGNRGWDGWMAKSIRWTWVWASSRSWWWTGKPGMLQSMGSQRVVHDWVTELNWTELSILLSMVVQHSVVILVLSQEEMNAHPSTLPYFYFYTEIQWWR